MAHSRQVTHGVTASYSCRTVEEVDAHLHALAVQLSGNAEVPAAFREGWQRRCWRDIDELLDARIALAARAPSRLAAVC